MSINQKSYQAQQFAKHHYRKLINAKTSLKQFKQSNTTITFSPSRTLTPLDRYEFNQTNNKLCNKLNEIYEQSAARIRQRRRRKNQRTKSISYCDNNKSKQENLQRQNIQIFQRILATKSTIGENWKKREKSLKSYSKLTRRKLSNTDQTLFNAFRQILVQSRCKQRLYKSRPSSSKQSSSHKINGSKVSVQI